LSSGERPVTVTTRFPFTAFRFGLVLAGRLKADS
jgi:hypothetical protein